MADELEGVLGHAIEGELVSSRIGVLPVGSMEYHGPHLPLGTDSLIAREVAGRVADKLGAVLLPVVHYTGEYWTKGFRGTISIKSDVFVDYMIEVLSEIMRSGLGGVLILSAHGENAIYCPEAARIVAREFPEKKLMFISWWDPVTDLVFEDEGRSLRFIGEHGGFEEGSLIAYLAPDSIDTSQAPNCEYKQEWAPLEYFAPSKGKHSRKWDGYWGRIDEIDADKGEIMIRKSSEAIAKLVRNYLRDKHSV